MAINVGLQVNSKMHKCVTSYTGKKDRESCIKNYIAGVEVRSMHLEIIDNRLFKDEK